MLFTVNKMSKLGEQRFYRVEFLQQGSTYYPPLYVSLSVKTVKYLKDSWRTKLN